MKQPDNVTQTDFGVDISPTTPPKLMSLSLASSSGVWSNSEQTEPVEKNARGIEKHFSYKVSLLMHNAG